MQKARLPELLHPLRFAETGRSVSGVVALAGMSRLREFVIELDGDAQLEMTGGKDPQGRPFLSGQVQAALTVCCQRCLQPMTYVVDTEFYLSPVRSEEEAEQLPESYDPLVLPDEDSASLQALVEDELMLGLPVVAMHAPEDCAADTSVYEGCAEPVAAKKPHPFAALEKLKSASDKS